MAQLKTSNVHGDLHVSGDITQSGSKVYHEGNKPSKADVGLGSVDNYSRAHYDGRYATAAQGTKADSALQAGDFGLGGTLTYNPDITLEAQHINGFGTALHGNRSPSDSPNGVIGKVLYVGASSWGTQLWFSYNEGKAWFRNKETGKPYETWKEFIHSGNLLASTGSSTAYPMTQKATTDALNAKANTTTQIIAGTGLTGGGTLAVNRTLNVAYGTTAGTAAQGNDARLSNAREWTAAEVSQAEAEAGTATTARKWTSQRVRQNVSSYAYSKAQTDNLIAGATTGAKVWQNKANVTQLEVNVYHKLAFSSPRTLKLPLNPPENSFVEVYATTGDLKSTIIDPRGKTLMGLSESMVIDRQIYGLRLEFLDNSWRVGM